MGALKTHLIVFVVCAIALTAGRSTAAAKAVLVFDVQDATQLGPYTATFECVVYVDIGRLDPSVTPPGASEYLSEYEKKIEELAADGITQSYDVLRRDPSGGQVSRCGQAARPNISWVVNARHGYLYRYTGGRLLVQMPSHPTRKLLEAATERERLSNALGLINLFESTSGFAIPGCHGECGALQAAYVSAIATPIREALSLLQSEKIISSINIESTIVDALNAAPRPIALRPSGDSFGIEGQIPAVVAASQSACLNSSLAVTSLGGSEAWVLTCGGVPINLSAGIARVENYKFPDAWWSSCGQFVAFEIMPPSTAVILANRIAVSYRGNVSVNPVVGANSANCVISGERREVIRLLNPRKATLANYLLTGVPFSLKRSQIDLVASLRVREVYERRDVLVRRDFTLFKRLPYDLKLQITQEPAAYLVLDGSRPVIPPDDSRALTGESSATLSCEALPGTATALDCPDAKVIIHLPFRIEED